TERIKTLEYLKKLGKERFVRILEKIDFTAFDVNVYITNEEIDKGVMLQNLLYAMQAVPEYRTTILKEVFDLMGLNSSLIEKNEEDKKEEIIRGNNMSLPAITQNPQEIVTAANVAGMMKKLQ
ncbi:MAG: hypothetical protein QXO70_01625, partial [Candidatus Pacearchaeota archaeon]